MEQSNPPVSKTVEKEIVAGLRVVELEYKVRVPVFEEVKVQVPVFENVAVKVPVGFDEVINDLALNMSKSVLAIVDAKLTDAIKQIVDEVTSKLRNTKVTEDVVIKTRDVTVDRPVFIDKTIEVSRPIYVDREIINPVIKDVEVSNAIVIDKAVTNAVITDIKVLNAIVKDVEVERAVVREKIVDVIHPRYLNLQGEPVS